MDKQTAPAADSTTPKATPIATSSSNSTADASTSAQTPTSDPSTLTPILAEEKDNKTLIEYIESTAKQSVTSLDDTFTLIEKLIYFFDRQLFTL